MSRYHNSGGLIERLIENGANDWLQVKNALEDGAYLRIIGADDLDMVEEAHEYASKMADSYPEYKFITGDTA